MIACQFIFQPGEYDVEFTELDDSIDAFVQQMPGFIGIDKWQSVADAGVLNYIYYFTDMDAVRQLSQFGDHLTAKREYARWYDGYKIIVSEVHRSYGDGRIEGLTPID